MFRFRRPEAPKYTWMETRRTNIWGTMDCIAVVLTDGDHEWLIGAAYPALDDFSEKLAEVRAKAEQRCAEANALNGVIHESR